MNCPKCKKPTFVLDSRPTRTSVRRRRICECGWRGTTFESAIDIDETFKRTIKRLHDLEHEIVTLVDAVQNMRTFFHNWGKPGKTKRKAVSRLDKISPSEKRTLLAMGAKLSVSVLKTRLGRSRGFVRKHLKLLGVKSPDGRKLYMDELTTYSNGVTPHE